MLEAMRTRLREVMKARGDTHAELEKNILRVALAELDALRLSNAKAKPEEFQAKIRKLIQSNNETAQAHAERAELVQCARLHEENEILEKYLPKMLTVEEIKETLTSIRENLLAAASRSEGQAIGVAMKYLKSKNAAVDGSLVSQVVRELTKG